MPKTYTATEVAEIVRECLGEDKICDCDKGKYVCPIGIRNALRHTALERLEALLAPPQQ